MRTLTALAVLAAALAGCNNVLPKSVEEKVRTHLREGRERARMESEVAVFTTAKGAFVVRLFADVPRSVQNVRTLIDEKGYDGVRIHRAVKTPAPFVVQFGDPKTKGEPGKDFVWEPNPQGLHVAGMGDLGKLVAFEESKHKHARGAVALAHRESDTRGGSQLYITLGPQPQLDGKFTVIGQVIEGMEVVDKLERGDAIEKVRLVEDGRAKGD
jgi:peptidyl-prolyl cis-trans isomerase B (cyclophilin B)